MLKRINFFPATICFWAIFGAFGCITNTEDEPLRPNIIWINAEDISPAFGAYGDPNAITPVIDSLARMSVVFNNAYAVAPICSPSRSTLVTGLYATSLGTQHLRSETPFPEELKTLPELFTSSGYFTSIYGKSDYNFDPEGLWQYWEGDEAPWRKRKGNQPFLSVFTLNMTHEGKGNSREKYVKETQNLPDSLRQNKPFENLPPHFPDNEEARDILKRYYELITVFDQKVGSILKNLEDDGELENTIIFVFSDHGFGLPRYKRWLYETGLRVPLVVHMPEKFNHLNPFELGLTNNLVSFVDFVPTALSLAGITVPDYMEGVPFLGLAENSHEPRKDIYAFRSRADNVYEMSRAVRDNQYLYIRHFMPHLPYIQSSKLFGDDKDSYRMLRALLAKEELHEEGKRMFGSKPLEELYDLINDPYELHNLIDSPEHQEALNHLRQRLKEFAIETADLGFLYESEMVLRASGSSPYYLRGDEKKFPVAKIFEAAEMVGKATPDQIRTLLKDKEPAIQFWGIMGVYQFDPTTQKDFIEALLAIAGKPNTTNRIAASELLFHLTRDHQHLQTLIQNLDHDVSEVVLQAARALELCMPVDNKIMEDLEAVLARFRNGDDGDFPYIDYNFAAFISWSLEAIIEYNQHQNLFSETYFPNE